MLHNIAECIDSIDYYQNYQIHQQNANATTL